MADGNIETVSVETPESKASDLIEEVLFKDFRCDSSEINDIKNSSKEHIGNRSIEFLEKRDLAKANGMLKRAAEWTYLYNLSLSGNPVNTEATQLSTLKSLAEYFRDHGGAYESDKERATTALSKINDFIKDHPIKLEHYTDKHVFVK